MFFKVSCTLLSVVKAGRFERFLLDGSGSVGGGDKARHTTDERSNRSCSEGTGSSAAETRADQPCSSRDDSMSCFPNRSSKSSLRSRASGICVRQGIEIRDIIERRRRSFTLR